MEHVHMSASKITMGEDRQLLSGKSYLRMEGLFNKAFSTQ